MKEAAASPTPILIVDDDQGQRSLLESFLKAQGYRTQAAASGEEALQKLRAGAFALMISDVRMPGISGIEMLRRVRQEHPTLPVLLVTAFADIRSAVAAMRDGAVNYLAKPIDLDELIASVHFATDRRATPAAAGKGAGKLPAGIITESPLMQAVYRDAGVIAPSATRILITGESGVGKEVVAELIHAWSPRSAGPFVRVNCAAIPENLLESELFGHEKGAFTGALQQRIGRFEEANGGTIFLDEIGELPLPLQAKLLRVIHDGSFGRIGSNHALHTDARVLAATNRDLEAQITAGNFREDLFYRLNVVPFTVPPLRERKQDIPLLAREFLAEFGRQYGRPRVEIGEEAVATLSQYHWPGNVRELKNVIERVLILNPRALRIERKHLPPLTHKAGTRSTEEFSSLQQARDAYEREYILKKIEEARNNVSHAAELLGLERSHLYRKMKALGIAARE